MSELWLWVHAFLFAWVSLEVVSTSLRAVEELCSANNLLNLLVLLVDTSLVALVLWIIATSLGAVNVSLGAHDWASDDWFHFCLHASLLAHVLGIISTSGTAVNIASDAHDQFLLWLILSHLLECQVFD
jgi:hypothetical protein